MPDVARLLGATGRPLLALARSRRPVALAVTAGAWSIPPLTRSIFVSSHLPAPSLGDRVLAVGAVALVILAGAPVHVAHSAAPTTDQGGMGAVGAAAIRKVQSTVRAAIGYERRTEDALPFVYFHDDRTTTMLSSDGDMARARRYRRSGEPMLWFRRDGQEYVVRDPNVLREVDALWQPVGRLGAEQGRIGAQQGALGAEQGRHGARQGKLGAQQGVIGARQGAVAARLGLLAAREGEGVSASERREIAREREALDRQMRELDREMEALTRDAREDASPMRELGDEMAGLGRQMAVLGGRMDEASRRAQAGMHRLVDRAIRDGAAQAVR